MVNIGACYYYIILWKYTKHEQCNIKILQKNLIKWTEFYSQNMMAAQKKKIPKTVATQDTGKLFENNYIWI